MTSSNYMPNVVVELSMNGGVNIDPTTWTWTDVSNYVELDQGIKVSNGRTDEKSETSTMQVQLTLDNTDGRFTPERSSSPYYPDLALGRPIRVTASVPGLNSTMEDGITGWTGTNATLAQSSTQARNGTYSCRLTVTAGADASADSPSGVSGFPVVGGSSYVAWAWYRSAAVIRSARTVVEWYDSGGSFISSIVGTPVNTSTAGWVRAVTTGTAPSNAAFARVRARLASAGASEVHYVDDVMFGSHRAVGFVDEWPVEWDGTEATSTVTLTASGRIAGLSRFNLDDVLTETYEQAGTLLAHYRLAEAEGAVEALDRTLTPEPPLARMTYDVGSTSGNNPKFGQGTGPDTDGSRGVLFDQGGRPLVTKFTGSDFTGSWTVVVWFTTTTSLGCHLLGFGGMFVNLNTWLSNQISLSTAQTVASEDPGGVVNDGETHMIALTVSTINEGTSTPTHTVELHLDNQGVVADQTDTTTTGLKTGELILGQNRSDVWGTSNVISLNSTPDATFFQLAVYREKLSDAEIVELYDAGTNGFGGGGTTEDTIATRLTRYLAWADTPAGAVSAPETLSRTVAHIGTQGGSVESALRWLEATEGGLLLDRRDGTIAIRGRSHRYGAASAFTLDASDHELAQGFRPVLDRTQLVNDVTASNANDTRSARFVDETSMDRNGPASGTVQLATRRNDDLIEAAGWAVNRFANPRTRVGQLAPVDVLGLGASKVAAIAAADVSTRFTVTNLPTQAANTTLGFYIEGYDEVIAPESWSFSWNVSAEDLWHMWKLDDSTWSVLGTSTVLGF